MAEVFTGSEEVIRLLDLPEMGTNSLEAGKFLVLQFANDIVYQQTVINQKS